jgi:hypothetical protein
VLDYYFVTNYMLLIPKISLVYIIEGQQQHLSLERLLIVISLILLRPIVQVRIFLRPIVQVRILLRPIVQIRILLRPIVQVSNKCSHAWSLTIAETGRLFPFRTDMF